MAPVASAVAPMVSSLVVTLVRVAPVALVATRSATSLTPTLIRPVVSVAVPMVSSLVVTLVRAAPVTVPVAAWGAA